MLAPNTPAPLDVQVQNDTSQPVSLRQYLGQWIVLYFYPKDDTPGCTKEACSFRDYNTAITELGAVIIGVSKDKPQSHQKFTAKHHLNYPLWSDPEHQLMEAFGSWQPKKFLGKSYMGTVRSTFLINPQGNIIHVWENVRPNNHAQEVFEILKSHISA